MSATTHGLGVGDDFGDSVARVVGSDVDAVSEQSAQFDASAGDDWGSVLAVACLLVGLIVVALLLGGG